MDSEIAFHHTSSPPESRGCCCAQWQSGRGLCSLHGFYPDLASMTKPPRRFCRFCRAANPYRLRSCPIDLTGPVPGSQVQGTGYLWPGAGTVPLSVAGVTCRGPVDGRDVRLVPWIRGR
jgi:hypothetical protein